MSGRYPVCAAILGIVLSLAACSGGSARSTDDPTRSPSASSTSSAVSPQTPVPAGQLRLSTRERVPAETVRANGVPMGYGLQRDGTLLVVWADELPGAYDEEDTENTLCHRAFLLQPPTGEATVGPLPDGNCWANPVTSVRSGFVIDGRAPSVVRPDGSVERFRAVPAGVLRRGDLAGSSALGRLQVLRPRSATMFTLHTDPDIQPRLLADGTIWGHAALLPNNVTSATAVWSRDARSWRRFTVDTGTAEDWGTCCYEFGIAAAGARVAAWACGDMGSSGVCGDKLAITTNAGDTWTTLDGQDRPFTVGAGFASGGTLAIMPSSCMRRRFCRTLWRSTNQDWTRFEKVDLPRGLEGVRAEDGGFSGSIQRMRSITIVRIDETGVVHELPAIMDPPPLPAPAWTETPLSTEDEVVQKAFEIEPVIGSGDGSLLLGHYHDANDGGGGQQLLRIVRPDGLVKAYLAGREVPTQGVAAGFLALDDYLGVSPYVDSSGQTAPVNVAETPVTSAVGDTAIVLSGGRRLALFRASDQTIFPLPGPSLRRGQGISGAALDAQGTLWALVGASIQWSVDNGATWRGHDLDPHGHFDPEDDSYALVVAGGTVVVYDWSGLGMSPYSGKIAFTTDQGRNWRMLTRPRGFTRANVHVLADGRILLGPQAGRYWRARSARNSGFEAIDAGPIQALVVAGESVYGLPYDGYIDQRVLPADRGVVWVSRDNADTWVVATRCPGDVSCAAAAQ